MRELLAAFSGNELVLRYWMSQFEVRFGLFEGILAAILAIYLVRLRPVPLVVFCGGFAASLEVVLPTASVPRAARKSPACGDDAVLAPCSHAERGNKHKGGRGASLRFHSLKNPPPQGGN